MVAESVTTSFRDLVDAPNFDQRVESFELIWQPTFATVQQVWIHDPRVKLLISFHNFAKAKSPLPSELGFHRARIVQRLLGSIFQESTVGLLMFFLLLAGAHPDGPSLCDEPLQPRIASSLEEHDRSAP